MSKSNVDESTCLGLGNYDERTEKCLKCERKKECEDARLDVRETFIRKLDAGFRQQIIANFWSQGDSLSNEPFDDERRIIMALACYLDTHGITDSGLTGLTDAAFYAKAVEFFCDFVALLKTLNQVLPKCRSDAEFEVRAEPTLTRLEDKYSKIANDKIYGEPDYLLEVMKKIYYNDYAPKVIAQTSTVASLATRGFQVGFNPANVPRFRRADIDHTPKP